MLAPFGVTFGGVATQLRYNVFQWGQVLAAALGRTETLEPVDCGLLDFVTLLSVDPGLVEVGRSFDGSNRCADSKAKLL